MFCEKCGAQIPEGSVFCENCGAKIEYEQQAPPVQPVQQEVRPIKPETAKPKKKKTGHIIALAAVGAVVIALAVLIISMFPLKVSAEAEGKLTTFTGRFEELGIKVKANQPILDVKYALAPSDPSDITNYDAGSSGFSLGKKSFTIGKLTVEPGESELDIYVKTLFGEQHTSLKLTSDMGYTTPPDKFAMVNVAEGEKLISNELIVRFKSGASEEEVGRILSDHGAVTVGRVYLLGEYQVKFPESGEIFISGKKGDLERESLVEDVYYNMYYEDSISFYPNDPQFDDWSVETPDGNNWGLEAIDAPGAWQYMEQIGSTKVGVIDTWLQYDHPDLNVPEKHAYILPTDEFKTMEDVRDFYGKYDREHDDDENCLFCDMRDHGTHCAGIIGAKGDNNEGGAGVDWNADLYFATWWYLHGNSKGQLDIGESSAAMHFNFTRLVAAGCRVISVSIGSAYPSEPGSAYEISETERWENTMRTLDREGYDFLIFKAAGNECDDAENYMLNRIMTGGEYSKKHIVIVGSAENTVEVIDRDESWTGHTEKVYDLAWYSNYGPMIDVVAPGSDIFSTVPLDDYMMMSGTSMATPMAAGVGALCYGANPDLTCEQVKEILKVTSRNYVIADHGDGYEVYLMVNAERAVGLALKKESIPPYVEPQLGFVTGIVQDARTLDIIERAAVRATNLSTGTAYEANVINGTYSLTLEPGDYSMDFSARGYVPATISRVTIEAGAVQYNMLLNMVRKETGTGVASGHIIDAFNGEYIAGADFNIYKGVGNTSGTPVTSGFVSDDGYYSVQLEPGNYTIVASQPDYMDGSATIVVTANDTRPDQDCILTPILDEGEIRIVLTWGEYPTDLDAHLIVLAPDDYDELTQIAHVYWDSTTWLNEDEELYLNLDVDDRSSYGPETISIYRPYDGAEYYFFVHDYNNRESGNTSALSLSGAQVKVYIAGRADPIVFNVPSMDGNLWEVFHIAADGTIEALNFMSYHERPSTIGEE